MKLKLVPVVVVLLFGIFMTSAFAASDRAAAVRKNSTSSAGILASPSASLQIRAKSNLSAVKLKVCQTKVSGITKRVAQLNRFVTNMVGKFDAIALRVESFYETKVVASGKSLSNYDELVTDIDTQKGLVAKALAKAQTDSEGFVCEEGDPKGLLNQYRLNMQAVKQALGDYRKSIRNLIVGVHTLVPTTTDSESEEETSKVTVTTATSSATPSASPTASPTSSPTPTPTSSPV